MSQQINLKEEIKKKEAVAYSTPIIDKPLTDGRKTSLTLKILIYLFIFAIISLAVFSTQVVISNQSGNSLFANIPGFTQLKNLAESANRQLKGEENDRINILLLGIGGKNHDGGLLTDTIIVASIEPSTEKVALISIPRDLTVPIEGMGWRKINSVNAYAEKKEPGSGGMAISQTVSDTLNIPIDYYFMIDFSGFAQIIDQLGGINVYVENTLDDYNYPVLGREDAYPYNSRWEHLHIDKGWQTMDGSLALKFARSRHGIGIEGSDFARAKRQQLIIEAVKNKMLNMSVLFKPTMISNILNTITDHMNTNLKIWEIIKLYGMLKDVQKENIINKVLDNGPSGLLVNAQGEDGAYILTPKSGDFSEIQYYISKVFADAPDDDRAKVISEKSTIEVHNGTWINGLASRISVDLEKYGFDVSRVANANQQNFQKTVIYDLTDTAKNESLTVLKNRTGANVSSDMPQWLIDDMAQAQTNNKYYIKPDFILILGRDADKTSSGAENTIQ